MTEFTREQLVDAFRRAVSGPTAKFILREEPMVNTKRSYLVTCDGGCGATLPEDIDRVALLETAKASGWRVVFGKNICPACSGVAAPQGEVG